MERFGDGRAVFLRSRLPAQDDMAELAARNQLILQVGHVERFNPVLSALEARLTHPRFIEAHRLSSYPNRSTDIGVVLDLMIHDLEIILHLVRSPVQNIDAVGVPVLSKGERYRERADSFRKRCVANVTSSRISPERMRKSACFKRTPIFSSITKNRAARFIGANRGRLRATKFRSNAKSR